MTALADIAGRLRADMRNTIEQYLGYDERLHEMLLEALVDDAMFQVEHQVVEIQDLRDEVATLQGEIENLVS